MEIYDITGDKTSKYIWHTKKHLVKEVIGFVLTKLGIDYQKDKKR